ncbi:ATP-binding protein [Roseateles sp.]|uniref:ATP-binding protein n=1 Tax=Roseateles sp. TaxID=1971397 RepID=UPI003267855B
MSATNRLILRRPEPAELFDGVCRICVASGHAKLAVIEVLDGSMAHRATARWADSNTPDRRTDCDDSGPVMLNTLTSAASNAPCISNDISQDPRLQPWAAWCLRNDIHAMAALPIQRNAARVGALLIYAGQRGYFQADMVALLKEMGEDLSFALDNADREKAHKAALDEKVRTLQLFNTLFDSASIPMAVFNLDDRKVVKVNDQWCSLLALTLQQIMGKSIDGLGCGLSDADRAIFYAPLDLGHAVVGLQARITDSRQIAHEVLLHAHVVDYLGTRCVLVVATEISDLQTAQEANLARAVAEDASRAKTDFLSRMSHELRTPLNAMLGFAQLLGSDPEGALLPAQAERVRLITDAGWHLLGLVNDVMDISHIEAGRFDVVTEGIDIAPIIDAAVSMSRPLARSQQVALTVGGLGVLSIGVVCDPRRMRQVLINLLSNACKYNRHGGTVKVEVSCQQGEVVVDVVDNGLGMTEEQMSHLFEPFNRLGNAGLAVEGTGIGLTLTKQLVELMKGRLIIESHPATGTRARVVLPRFELASKQAPPVTLVCPQGSPRWQRATVLSIDDNPVNQILVEQMLALCGGIQVLQADDGSTGLASALAHKPDLLLLDLQLPDMSGFEVLEALRADPRTASIPVVAVSASAFPIDIQRARAFGVLDYWTKPLQVESFVAGVNSILQSRLEHPVAVLPAAPLASCG